MLTYSKLTKPKRQDRPWLLFLLVVIWIAGTTFFHSPWEPYEPFVVAVVKGILANDSWVVPYVGNAPYAEIQPFYFWIFASILKLFSISGATAIANSIRIISTLIIFFIILLSGRIGSHLKAFKNGRTTILILVSTIGFINNAYQLSPNILVLLGFALYIYAVQRSDVLPGFSGCLLFIGLFFIATGFTLEFIVIALALLIIMPIVNRGFRNSSYLYTVTTGGGLFAIVFALYSYQLFHVNNDFFYAWKFRYSVLAVWHDYSFWKRLAEVFRNLAWYIMPGWVLVIWTFYKQKLNLLKDKIVMLNALLVIAIISFAIFSTRPIEENLFPIVLPITFIASLEIDSIRSSIGSLFNWFSIFIFGIIGLIIWALYFACLFDYPKTLTDKLLSFSQHFHYNFNIWQLSLAIIVTIIWLFMITRRHIRGREVVSNWASGTTYVLILFMTLGLPLFNSMLTFEYIVHDSLKYLKKNQCIATNGNYSTQRALWYYYENVSLMPVFLKIDFTLCNQAVIATDDIKQFDLTNWKIVWQSHRPIDKKSYYVIWHK